MRQLLAIKPCIILAQNWAQIARFRGKLTNVTIAYLLCLIMLKFFKKISMTDHEI